MLDVVEGVGGVDGEADQDDVCFGVGKRARAFVVFLSCRVPECKLDRLAVDAAVCYVVLEDCRYLL